MTVPTVVVPSLAGYGEGPVLGTPAIVHWVDIVRGEIHSTDIQSLSTRTITLPTMVGAAVPRAGGGFVAAVTEGFAQVDADGGYLLRAAVLPDGQRMNDAKCDPRGRLWAGSTEIGFAAGEGRLWVLGPDWSSTVVLDGLTLPNGMGWSPDERTFYLADTVEREILAFDVDLDAVSLSGKRVLARFDDEEGGMPDGLCVDDSGCLWVAMWGGGRVVRVAPDGLVLSEVRMPVTQPTSCAFVAPGTLWVTSARDGLGLADDGGEPDGSVFAVDAGDAAGLPSTAFAG